MTLTGGGIVGALLGAVAGNALGGDGPFSGALGGLVAAVFLIATEARRRRESPAHVMPAESPASAIVFIGGMALGGSAGLGILALFLPGAIRQYEGLMALIIYGGVAGAVCGLLLANWVLVQLGKVRKNG